MNLFSKTDKEYNGSDQTNYICWPKLHEADIDRQLRNEPNIQSVVFWYKFYAAIYKRQESVAHLATWWSELSEIDTLEK